MKRLSLVAACGRAAWAVLALLCAGLATAATVHAQELSVVERSPEDRASADKLSELLREPVVRLHPESAAARGADTAGCTGDVRRALILDSALRVVRLVRCRDGTTLSRTLDPQAAARTPYLGAFIAAELLAIDRELEAVEARKRAGSAPAAGSGDVRGRDAGEVGAGRGSGASAADGGSRRSGTIGTGSSDRGSSADNAALRAVRGGGAEAPGPGAASGPRAGANTSSARAPASGASVPSSVRAGAADPGASSESSAGARSSGAASSGSADQGASGAADSARVGDSGAISTGAGADRDGSQAAGSGEVPDTRGSDGSTRADTDEARSDTARRDTSAAESGDYSPGRFSPLTLRLSAGAELNALGEPFPGAVRPSLALGVALQPSAAGPRWLFELFVSAFGAGDATRGAEHLALRRNDGQLRIGGLYPLLGGRLELGGFAFLRGALTSVRYTGGAMPVENSQVRWGVGAGLLASLRLIGPFQLYVHGLADFATSRSKYRVDGTDWLKDPGYLVWVGAGLLVHFAP